jgi:hypothetical protein
MKVHACDSEAVTGAFVPYEAVVPSVVPGTILFLRPDTGISIGWIKVRSGTRSTPVALKAVANLQSCSTNY